MKPSKSKKSTKRSTTKKAEPVLKTPVTEPVSTTPFIAPNPAAIQVTVMDAERLRALNTVASSADKVADSIGTISRVLVTLVEALNTPMHCIISNNVISNAGGIAIEVKNSSTSKIAEHRYGPGDSGTI